MNVLSRSYRNGRWSFSIVPDTQSVLPVSSLLSVDCDAIDARVWTISLNAFQYTGGLLPFGAAQPTSNQASSAQSFKARITWAVDGQAETAVVDYFCRGCTFEVFAGNIRLDLFVAAPTITNTPPRLSGFLTPKPRTITAIASPSFTTQSILLGPGATSVQPVPARATAYRAIPGTSNIVLNTIVFTEVDNTGAALTQDPAMPATVAGVGDTQANRMSYTPLHPDAQFVSVTNNAVGLQSLKLQYLLDLG